ncbi:hypothetical protein MLD38_014989 [Melastoma candidum]|uniref:Uncharacterized protein n=1 Tax=Melastoma candidum TaxID=119954 RepID=A0ACB9RF71_9MYRT|nr:hypothetical protein MLD38_014989 [Melastoma candidum]
MRIELTSRLDAPVVFPHSGNIMFNDVEEQMHFVDFEYGSQDYTLYIRHFIEHAGYDCNYTLYPSKDELYHFLRHYLWHLIETSRLFKSGPTHTCWPCHLYWALIRLKCHTINLRLLGILPEV